MENKKKFLVIDGEKLNEIVNSESPHMVVEPLFFVNIYDGEEQYEKDLAPFSMSQRYIFAINWYVAEVNNGGHYQFYGNSTGIVWEDTMNGFEAIGAERNAEIVKESTLLFGGNPSKDREKRNKQMDLLNLDYGDFDALDEAFYESEKEMYKLFRNYIKANAKDFYFSGDVVIV